MLVDDTHAVMEKREFDSLLTYSTSLPTGTVTGKRWKSERMDGVWLLGEYGRVLLPQGMIEIKWREILVV